MQLNTIYRSVDYSLDGAGAPVMSSREYELIDAGVAESDQRTKFYIYFRTDLADYWNGRTSRVHGF